LRYESRGAALSNHFYGTDLAVSSTGEMAQIGWLPWLAKLARFWLGWILD
jgi:hypothetical protein